MSATDKLWTEKYRPTTLEALALDEDNRKVLEDYLDTGELPHLLLVGPPGSGKTTVARILYNTLDCSVLTLNASNERGIETVRNKIGSFVQGLGSVRWRIVFLDEADAMTADAQTAMRNLIEAYERARFILTANFGHRIIGPIQSRCQLLTLSAPPLKERYNVLARVLAAEGIKADLPTTLSYAERYPDMRRMLWAAQKAAQTHDPFPPATLGMVQTDGEELLRLVEAKDFRALVQLTASGDFDVGQGLRALFWAVPDAHKRAGLLRHIVGRAVHETGFTPDPIILFLATCAEAMEGL